MGNNVSRVMGKVPDRFPKEVADAVLAERKRFLDTETPEDSGSFDQDAAVEKAQRIELIVTMSGLLSIEIGPVNKIIADYLDTLSNEQIKELAQDIHRELGRAIVMDTFTDMPENIDREDVILDIEKALMVPQDLRGVIGVPERLQVVATSIERGYFTLDEVKAMIRNSIITPAELGDHDRNPALLSLREKYAGYDGPTVSLHDIFGVEDDKNLN